MSESEYWMALNAGGRFAGASTSRFADPIRVRTDGKRITYALEPDSPGAKRYRARAEDGSYLQGTQLKGGCSWAEASLYEYSGWGSFKMVGGHACQVMDEDGKWIPVSGESTVAKHRKCALIINTIKCIDGTEAGADEIYFNVWIDGKKRTSFAGFTSDKPWEVNDGEWRRFDEVITFTESVRFRIREEDSSSGDDDIGELKVKLTSVQRPGTRFTTDGAGFRRPVIINPLTKRLSGDGGTYEINYACLWHSDMGARVSP